MCCTHCGSGDVVEIRMHVGNQDLMFRRCGHCEAQGWHTGEDEIDLTEVLDIARA
ncbi:MAG: hypothetical protein ACOYN3_03850 [Acidimicrobiia bacterium]